MHIIAIGVDGYKPPLKRLTFAADDARELADTFHNICAAGACEPGEKIQLLNAAVEKSSIKAAFQKVAAVAYGHDILVVVFADHGKSVSGMYYYLPFTANLEVDELEKAGIAASELKAWIAGVKVSKRLIVIDTCESSEAITIGRSGDAETIARQTSVDRLASSLGETVLTASRQVAYEASSLRHGVLSYAILESLRKPRRPKEEITTKMLDADLVRRVPDISGKLAEAQQPYNKVTGDFPIGKTSAKKKPMTGAETATLSPVDFYTPAAVQLRKEPRPTSAVVTTLDRASLLEKISPDNGVWLHVAWRTFEGWVETSKIEPLKR